MIFVYTLKGCPWCTKVKSALRKHKLKFTERPSPKYRLPKGTASYPQVVVNGRLIGGYDATQKWLSKR
jgi:glutaredoxin